MTEWILQHEPSIRLSFFIAIFACMAIWEIRRPRRPLSQSKLLRWSNNLAIVVLNSLVVRFLFPTAAIGVALLAEQQGWGLLNYFQISPWLAIIAAVILLDGIIYFQHVLFHAVPSLWRLHRMHHTDLDLDVTSGARFHPIEIALSMLIKFAAIVALGAPAVAVLIFEVLLNGMAMFNHSNVRLPAKVDRYLRYLIVTPDMHRIHHSVIENETNSNFGFNLSIWDRFLGTYIQQPEHGHTGMQIGICDMQDTRFLKLHWMLILPFMGKIQHYAINRRQHRKDD
jgi:sterol desaturase/sphingolipid hydroxylase (fatty acid hydroxylase superfamily)